MVCTAALRSKYCVAALGVHKKDQRARKYHMDIPELGGIDECHRRPLGELIER